MLSRLAAENPDVFQDFGLFGIVKEVAVDDEGLLEFHDKFFPHPLYLDESQQVYEALGKRKITTLKTWNPLRIYRGFKEMKARLQSKSDLTGNMKGEGIVQGGIIILDKQGDARAVYLEETGSEPPVEDILAALKTLRLEESKEPATEQATEL